MAFLEKIFGSDSSRVLKDVKPIVDKINALEEVISVLPDEELKAKTVEFKNRLIQGQSLDSLLPEAFAVVREVSKRCHNERHFDVQLMGGIALHRGNIAEMRTGEGTRIFVGASR